MFASIVFGYFLIFVAFDRMTFAIWYVAIAWHILIATQSRRLLKTKVSNHSICFSFQELAGPGTGIIAAFLKEAAQTP